MFTTLINPVELVTMAAHNLHFFKVLMPGYDQNLMIPVASSPELKELKLSKRDKETALLRTRRSKDTLWKVDVCRREEDSKWCFSGDNWREFVKFHDLNVHEFLVFEHKGDLLFNVFVYDSATDGDGIICEKEFPPPTRRDHVQEHDRRRASVRVNPRRRSTSNTKASKNSTCSPCFTRTMAASHLIPSCPYLNIP